MRKQTEVPQPLLNARSNSIVESPKEKGQQSESESMDEEYPFIDLNQHVLEKEEINSQVGTSSSVPVPPTPQVDKDTAILIVSNALPLPSNSTACQPTPFVDLSAQFLMPSHSNHTPFGLFTAMIPIRAWILNHKSCC